MERTIKNIIVDSVVERLRTRLIDNVNDETVAQIVRAGKLQEDPTKGTGINVLVWPSEEEDPDELHTADKQRGLLSPTYEIGGGGYYMVRFKIYILIHFKGFKSDEDRDEARRRADVVKSRIKHELLLMNSNMPVNPDTGLPQDEFGETCIAVQIDKMHMTESGGPGNFIWKGDIHFSVLTEQLV